MTDATVAAFQRGVHAGPNMMMPAAKRAMAGFIAGLGRLDTIRAEVSERRITALGAFEAYNSIIDEQFSVYSKLIVVNDPTLYSQASASITAGRALELADREITLVNGALANDGHMTRGERVLVRDHGGQPAAAHRRRDQAAEPGPGGRLPRRLSLARVPAVLCLSRTRS